MLVFIRQTITVCVMSTTLKILEENPRKLVYFGSSDVDGERELRPILNAADECSISSFSSLKMIQSVDLPTFCHAVILDMRVSGEDAAEIIQWVGELQCPVALICLCEDYGQLQPYEGMLHLINDMVIADSLKEGELTLRITRALGSRRADLQRRQDQELLSGLLDNLPDSIYFKDRDSRFIRVNSAKANKHKKSPEAMVGKSDFDFFTQERARPAYEEEQKIMRTGEPVLGEVQKLTFDDGSVAWVNTSKLPLTDKFDRVIGTMGVSRDITAQKEGEKDQELLNELLDNIPDAIYFKDNASRFIRVNKAMASSFGKEVKDLVGKTDFDLFAEEHAKQSFKDEREIMSTGKPVIGKMEKEKFEDGSVGWVNTTKVPLHDTSGRIVGTMGISRNVTEQVNNEQKLEEVQRKLDEVN